MEKFQVSYETYQNIKKYEEKTKRPIATSVLLQIGEVLGKWNILHIVDLEVDEYQRYLVEANVVGTFDTHAEAKLKLRGVKKELSDLYNIKFNNKGEAVE